MKGETVPAAAVLAASVEAARGALEVAAAPLGTNPARVEEAERGCEEGDALVLAAHHGYGGLVARLLAEGADPNAVGSDELEEYDLEGIAPLTAALRSRKLEGDTALVAADRGGDDGIIDLLLEAGADREREDDGGWRGDGDGSRPLMQAAHYSRPDCLRRLLAEGAAVDARDILDATALHYVATSSAEDSPRLDLCALLLLEKGADKDAQDAEGCTPLMRAAHGNRPGIVAMLLRAGADRALSDDKGTTALKLAETEGHEEVVALLRG